MQNVMQIATNAGHTAQNEKKHVNEMEKWVNFVNVTYQFHRG